MRPAGMIIPVGAITATALGLLLAATPAAAQASVTRQITSEPVETTVTRWPNGTEVTRRILSPDPGITTYAAPPLQYPPISDEALTPQYVEPAAPALVQRQVTTTSAATTSAATTSGEATRAPVRSRATRTATTRTPTTRTPTTRTETTRTVATRRAAPGQAVAAASDQALVLSPAQRLIIYRTVQREYYPAAAQPPVVAPTEVYAPPPPAANYPLRTIYPADNAYGYYSGAQAYAYDPYTGGYRSAPLVVGARLPANVPLVAVPQPVAARVPVAAPYSYAVLDNRVFLVDPATDIIVAEITP